MQLLGLCLISSLQSHNTSTMFVTLASCQISYWFKILLLTFKAVYGHAPGYFIDLTTTTEQPRYNLRSASGLTLQYRVYSSALPCGISAIWKKKCRIKFTLPRQMRRAKKKLTQYYCFFFSNKVFENITDNTDLTVALWTYFELL